MSTKISKTSYFSFTFKLNEKKEVPLKKFSLERLQEVFAGGVVWSLIGGWKYFEKKGGLKRKGWRKTRGGDVTLKETM